MAAIKSYTDLQQSKKLAEILPIESADMYYHYTTGVKSYYEDVPKYVQVFNHFAFFHNDIPCWSLAALLGVLPEYNLQRTDWGNKTEYKIVVTIDEENYASKNYGNPVDACYEMIIKLHELNLL